MLAESDIKLFLAVVEQQIFGHCPHQSDYFSLGEIAPIST
jgi:hypothetical protein